jgi:hypothetical protein
MARPADLHRPTGQPAATARLSVDRVAITYERGWEVPLSDADQRDHNGSNGEQDARVANDFWPRMDPVNTGVLLHPYSIGHIQLERYNNDPAPLS